MQHTFLAGRRDHHGDRGERRTHREGAAIAGALTQGVVRCDRRDEDLLVQSGRQGEQEDDQRKASAQREGGDGDQGKGQVDPGVVREVERHLERCQCDDRCIDQRCGDASWKTFQPGRHGRR
jgi:hypothetical protein